MPFRYPSEGLDRYQKVRKSHLHWKPLMFYFDTVKGGIYDTSLKVGESSGIVITIAS
jgi:hypothetical protein